MPDAVDEVQPAPAAVKKTRGKAGIKKEEATKNAKDEENSDAPAAPKKRASRGKKMVEEAEKSDSGIENVKKTSSKKASTRKGRKSTAKNDSSEDSDVDMNDIPEASADLKNGSAKIESSPAQDTVVEKKEEESPAKVKSQLPTPKTGRRSKRYGR